MPTAGETMGKGSLAITVGEDREFTLTRAGGFDGEWTAHAGADLDTELDLTADGDDYTLTVPGDARLIGNPWVLRNDGVTVCRGSILPQRATEEPDDGTITVIGLDTVNITITVGGGGGGTAATTTTVEGAPPFLDPTTVAAEYEATVTAFGLDPDDEDFQAESAILTGNRVTDNANTVAGRLVNASKLWARQRVEKVIHDRNITAATVESAGSTDALDVLRWAVANPWTGAYAEVGGHATANVFTLDEDLPQATTSTETRALIWLTPGAADAYWEFLTQPATGPLDASEDALLIEADTEPQFFNEGMSEAGLGDEDRRTRAFGPTLGVWLQLKSRVEGGFTTLSMMGPAGWVTLRVTDDDDGDRILIPSVEHPDGFYDSGQPWKIGLGGSGSARLRVAWIERDHDDVPVLDFRADDAASATSVPDGVNGTWTASGAATIVEPSSGTGPDLSDANPAALGVASPGVSPDASRADHVHTLPELDGLVVPYTTGDWLLLGHPTTLSTSALSSGRIYYCPIWVADDLTIDQMAITVTSAGAAASILTVGLYTCGATGRPTTKIGADWGTLAVDGLATPTASVSRSLTRGRYFIACFANGAPTLRSITQSLLRARTATAASAITPEVAYIESGASSLPSTATPSSTLSAFAPTIAVRTA